MLTENLQAKTAPSTQQIAISLDDLKKAEMLCLMAGSDIERGNPISTPERRAILAAVAIVKQNPRGTFGGIMARRCIPLIDTWEGCHDEQV